MVEHALHQPVLGIACDGSGLGEDGGIWGVVAKIWQPPPNLDDFCVDLPKPPLLLVAKMMATDPTQRPRDGGSLVSELLSLGKLPDQIATARR